MVPADVFQACGGAESVRIDDEVVFDLVFVEYERSIQVKVAVTEPFRTD